jgi:hypothetical protein
MDKPITGQLKAVEEIESWKENAMDYLQRESLEFKGQRLFQSFYIPKADLIHNKENVHDIVCVFGFKYSLVYQRLLATLIFVANENDPRINAPGVFMLYNQTRRTLTTGQNHILRTLLHQVDNLWEHCMIF